jgi:hypothetical protein
MRKAASVLTVVASSLLATGAALATEWVAGFTSTSPESFTGTDNTAVANYTDTLGGNPNSYTVTFPLGGSAPAGWLTQGSRGSVPTTAKFLNPPGDGMGGRARFSTPLPATMDANGGVAFAWTARYGSYAMGRAPIQLCVTDTGQPDTAGGVEYNAFIRVQNGTTLAIQSNGGTLYTTIDALTISSVADGQYHQWSASVITSGTLAHWKLYLNGAQLLFSGVDGAHQFDPGTGFQQFSFQTGSNGFSGNPYIGLGDLQTGQDQWDFEFDCVAYKDDGISGNYTCGTSVVTCDSSVSPTGAQASAALRNSPAAPPSFTYTFTNTGSSNNGYTVAETDAAGVPASYAWLSLDKTGSAAPLGPMATDSVVATITDTSMAGGLHTAYITFTDTCNPANKHIRRIDLTITDCESTVSPSGEVARCFAPDVGGAVSDVVFTVTNTGRDGLTYSVTKEGTDCGWLTLNKTGGGPLANGVSDQVTVSINPAGLTTGTHTCQLRFANTTSGCSNSPPDHLRTVVLNVLGPSMVLEQFKAEYASPAWSGSDLTASCPLFVCDPEVASDRLFHTQGITGGTDLVPAGWLTQGSIGSIPTTAKFYNPLGDATRGRERFRTFLPFGSTYDPAKGMAVAWRMRIGNYAPVRAPIQIVFPRVTGPFGTSEGTSAIPNDVSDAFIRVQNGTDVNILRNGGAVYSGINTLVLPASVAGSTENDYHQWTAAICYSSADQFVYWNLWVDGQKLMFTGSNADGSAGSPVGPGGQAFSFRTFLETGVTGDPYVGLGEVSTSPANGWDFEFDWVRMLTYNVSGCPFWDGGGSCSVTWPWPDVDKDGDADQADFAVLQTCFSGDGVALSDPTTCGRFNRDGDTDVDTLDVIKFEKCATGPGIELSATNPPAGCEL